MSQDKIAVRETKELIVLTKRTQKGFLRFFGFVFLLSLLGGICIAFAFYWACGGQCERFDVIGLPLIIQHFSTQIKNTELFNFIITSLGFALPFSVVMAWKLWFFTKNRYHYLAQKYKPI